MTQEQWGLVSSIATTIGSAVAIIGLLVVIFQLWLQRRQTRLVALDALYAELDTHEARLARAFIYNAKPEQLTWEYLHATENNEARKYVEDTLAHLERAAYRIFTKQVPETDAFNLYGGVLLSVAHMVWYYIEEQRNKRKKNSRAHKLKYRRYLEKMVEKWIPKYCREIRIDPPPKGLGPREKLDRIFQ